VTLRAISESQAEAQLLFPQYCLRRGNLTMAAVTVSFSSFSQHSTSFPSASQKRPPKKKMSVTQTYYLAHTARNKLAKEAARADHDLRLLVGHANLLDSLMLELANAEREQERWFNQTVSSVSTTSQEESRHIRWADTIVEQVEDESDSDSDSSDDLRYNDEDVPMQAMPSLRQTPSSAPIITTQEVDSDSDSDSDLEDDEEDYERLTLTRTRSRQSPPELLDDIDEDSEEDSLPPSPPQPSFDSFPAQGSAGSTASLYHAKPPPQAAVLPLSDADQPSFFDQGGYYVSAGNQGPMIQAY
jgi:hypothetical protein